MTREPATVPSRAAAMEAPRRRAAVAAWGPPGGRRAPRACPVGVVTNAGGPPYSSRMLDTTRPTMP
jgi:hypothetical protein